MLKIASNVNRNYSHFSTPYICLFVFFFYVSGFPSLGDIECSACKYVVKYLDGMLVSNKTETAIVNAVERLCGYMPNVIENEVSNSNFTEK